MKLDQAKEEFIQTWGSLGSSWGINRTMSQIHALLLVSNKPLSTEDIMEELQISRGNANMNIRALIDWGLVRKQLVPGERKEFFQAGKDIWEMARKIAEERRKRELEPVIQTLSELKQVDENTEEADHFKTVVTDLEDFTQRIQSTLDRFIRSDRNWFYKSLMALIKK
ncbi:MAG: ArsR family transcriptional regulator [Bacteroidota bacterium]|nr:ArsR family transcriptional regulator [Bacteroidota bacterium]MDX5426566.1 ArsR family transcriptional regulator [Bacteroidota bacterium]MDX5449029.1 ArsR family transcriptional regulator [Bacteroidota bacterium]MDX5504581.1 ArsR family transcriptional regulator [Bacteroidota bacterium]